MGDELFKVIISCGTWTLLTIKKLIMEICSSVGDQMTSILTYTMGFYLTTRLDNFKSGLMLELLPSYIWMKRGDILVLAHNLPQSLFSNAITQRNI